MVRSQASSSPQILVFEDTRLLRPIVFLAATSLKSRVFGDRKSVRFIYESATSTTTERLHQLLVRRECLFAVQGPSFRYRDCKALAALRGVHFESRPDCEFDISSRRREVVESRFSRLVGCLVVPKTSRNRRQGGHLGLSCHPGAKAPS